MWCQLRCANGLCVSTLCSATHGCLYEKCAESMPCSMRRLKYRFVQGRERVRERTLVA